MREFDRDPVARTSLLWLFPLVGGLLPFAATIAAFALYNTLFTGHVCNPFVDGCVSISRTARYGVANHLFRVLMLPAAALQALTWVLCSYWLSDIGAVRDRALRILPWLGVASALLLGVYATLLGTGGQPYSLARRYGIPTYFVGTYLCMVITATIFRRLVGPTSTTVPARLQRLLFLLALFMTGAGLVQIGVRPYIVEKSLRGRLTNVLEWNTGLAFTVFFTVLAYLWYHTRFSVQPATDGRRTLAAGSAGGEPAGELLQVRRRTQ